MSERNYAILLMNTKAKQSDFPPILQCIYLLKYCIKQLYQTDKRMIKFTGKAFSFMPRLNLNH